MNDIVKNIKSIFKTKQESINSQDAFDIQEAHIKKLEKKKKQKLSYTPPYLTIEEQIFDENVQIAKCAVYNLVQTAINTPKYKSAIIELLEKHSKSKSLPGEVKDFISEKINDL